MIEWVPGDSLRLDIPAQSASLRAGGANFLTRAFHTTGALAADNRVTRITQFEDCAGGSTGSKLLLSVEYAQPSPALHTDLFVKFSRDFKDDIRDRARVQMEREVHFALLSRSPEFPIDVPACYFADYQQESGTGILITQRIGYGQGNIEPHCEKCLDYQVPNALQHYRALVTALARLAGTHRAGKLPDTVERDFPYDANKLSVSNRRLYSPQQIRNRVVRYADFAALYPQLLPDNIRSAEFVTRLAEEAPRFMSHLPVAQAMLAGKSRFIALCHWNAHIDNGWFWRNTSGDLECGLMDWGNVGQMNIAMGLWGCLSAAETPLWDNHLGELLELFASEFMHCGGPTLDLAELQQHLLLYAGTMGLAWLLDAPPLIVNQIPELSDVENRYDERFRNNETARAQLQILTVFLNLWETQDMAALLDQLESGCD